MVIITQYQHSILKCMIFADQRMWIVTSEVDRNHVMVRAIYVKIPWSPRALLFVPSYR